MSPEALAYLGDGEIAYVKTIRSEDVRALFLQVTDIEPGLKLLRRTRHGTLIMPTESLEAAIANATVSSLKP